MVRKSKDFFRPDCQFVARRSARKRAVQSDLSLAADGIFITIKVTNDKHV